MQTVLTVIVASLIASAAILILQVSEPSEQHSDAPADAELVAG